MKMQKKTEDVLTHPSSQGGLPENRRSPQIITDQ